ncbi:hypothetical protein Pmar_PMAR020770 [Perkinsus marinus ATCC 50983]|uniref:Uncharacterized protein n=1 Tax=Perkinsus marinus (strain ATCC 50983 / TXsc) TaxID=423536 RepID=C5KQT3_PERM5|nr:hypothetical protein Pmar_PMAR020770 [Perkinsus marinus ATCC 50983]EER13179.1 hypothetical protein Pmar_PMAR020770 [Perkinsus marinus ATCC 50983]|eukprot:XP_002781384.1 hypothetical protein Pmar_PMAR020770 [Perkinsus marinus ATCC 50983]
MAQMIEGPPENFSNYPRLLALLEGATIWMPGDSLIPGSGGRLAAVEDPMRRRDEVSVGKS